MEKDINNGALINQNQNNISTQDSYITPFTVLNMSQFVEFINLGIKSESLSDEQKTDFTQLWMTFIQTTNPSDQIRLQKLVYGSKKIIINGDTDRRVTYVKQKSDLFEDGVSEILYESPEGSLSIGQHKNNNKMFMCYFSSNSSEKFKKDMESIAIEAITGKKQPQLTEPTSKPKIV